MAISIDIPEGYESLGLALGEAVAQASRGKGAERHAESGERFSDQLIMSIPKRLGEGGECFCLGQALKKICESRRLPPDRARAELLGAVNYLAAAWCLLGGMEGAAKEQASRLMAGGRVVSMPDLLFSPGADVEFRVGGEWLRGAYVRPLDSGMHEVLHGSSLLAVKEPSLRKAEPEPVRAPDGGDAPRTKEELFERIRDCSPAVYGPAPEDAVKPLFADGTAVEYCAEGIWKPGVYAGVDPEGRHVVESRGIRRHLDGIPVREA